MSVADIVNAKISFGAMGEDIFPLKTVKVLPRPLIPILGEL